MEYAYIFAFRDGKVLLVKNRRRGWEAPGGMIEEGETAEQAAHREFREETGRDLKILCYEFFNGGHVFYGIAGEKKEEADDTSIETAEFFDELPDNLAFSREEYMELIERGLACFSKSLHVNVRGNN